MIAITIETGNAAFAGDNRGPEIARILRRLADEVGGKGGYEGTLRDCNGNVIGVVEDDKYNKDTHEEVPE